MTFPSFQLFEELEKLSESLEKAREEARLEAEVEMKKVEDQQNARKLALEREANRLESNLEEAKQKCRRSGARKRLFEKEFESLVLGLDERRLDHQKTMESLKNEIDTLDTQLEGRRARTRTEREEALLRMENEFRTSLENKWRETLAKVKKENAIVLLDEQKKATDAYQDVVNKVGNLLHDEYKVKLENLDIEQKRRTEKVAVYIAQIDALTKAAEDAEEKLRKDRENLIQTTKLVEEERKDKSNKMCELRENIQSKWRNKKTPLQDRVEFMLRVDQVANYGLDALKLYEGKIKELEASGPILLNIKKREEMVVRMKSVVR